jgi:type II secretory pathway component PulC
VKLSPEAKIAALPARAAPLVEVTRSSVRAVLAAGPQRFMRGILLDPFFVDQAFVGFRLTRLYDGDTRFRELDLRAGDVVLRVNDLPIGRPEEFMRAWNELRTADEIRIDYLRGAEKRVARIRIRED